MSPQADQNQPSPPPPPATTPAPLSVGLPPPGPEASAAATADTSRLSGILASPDIVTGLTDIVVAPLLAFSQQPPPATPPLVSHNKHSMTTRAKNNIRKPIQKLNLHTQLISSADFEPTTVSQALKDPNWRKAMSDECNSLVKNGWHDDHLWSDSCDQVILAWATGLPSTLNLRMGNIKFNKEKEFESLGGENLQLAVTVEESEIVLNVGKDIVNGQVESGGCSGCKNINEISEKGNSGGEVVIVEEVKDVDEEVEGVVCGNSFAVLSDGENDLGLDSQKYYSSDPDGGSLLTTFVYAKCSQLEQRVLWEQLHGSSTFNMPWVVLGDFNTIRSDTERLGGRPRNCSSMAEFNECISSWGLLDLRFKGRQLSWCNGHQGLARSWAKLDKVFINIEFAVKYGDAKALLLKRISSDHSPILLQVVAKIERYGLAPFHFQNMWTSHVGFLDVVSHSWTEPMVSESCLHRLVGKLKE
ncbi:hypothetical protein LWI29_006805 [Acer saccharum]|uniref:Endonuclease/exonuclease/phosphatase domain-containing protein n=1 Tax=Acer saccharum TaxID=4024 RepID=A0AA39VSM5_ACESA|nr:hypothetical protein LWI29_006805 [Acer saccharum]